VPRQAEETDSVAQRIEVRLTDHLAGKDIPAGKGETVTFSLDGRPYEIDGEWSPPPAGPWHRPAITISRLRIAPRTPPTTTSTVLRCLTVRWGGTGVVH
jgi:hypothetical protein